MKLWNVGKFEYARYLIIPANKARNVLEDTACILGVYELFKNAPLEL
jgi:hypothetical protein